MKVLAWGLLAALLFGLVRALLREDGRLEAASARPVGRYRRMSNGTFVLGIAALVGVETAALAAAGIPWPEGLPLLLLSVYVPLNFLFFCNLVNVGHRRELIWSHAFLALCTGSYLLWGQVRWDLVLPLSLALSVGLCAVSLRDPQRLARQGLRALDEDGDAARARAWLERAARFAPEDDVVQHHLERARQASEPTPQGRREQG